MRRILTAALAVLALCAGRAGAAEIGVGAFGGVSIPVLNDLSKQGTQFGARVPVNLLPLLTVEPFFATSSLGDAEETFVGISYTRDGGKVTGFGANALLTFGSPAFRLFPIVGIGSYKTERDGAEELTDIGYNFGLGVGFSPIPKLSVSVRGELNMIVTDETSQKAANVTVGASYAVFSIP
jgi:hypothetical protein